MLLIMSIFLLRYRGIPSGSLGFQRNHEKTEERGFLHNVKSSFFVYMIGLCIGCHLQHHCVIFVSCIISCLCIYLTGAEVRIILEEF